MSLWSELGCFNVYFEGIEVRNGPRKNILSKPVCKSLFCCDETSAEGVRLQTMHHFPFNFATGSLPVQKSPVGTV